ncbi:MAG TPA: bifunctional DNA primase/polymerase [Alphaproteobacteria bacterium]|nr:bifunctional DNA primase/polymerase [Alphaproteobacteria bacterium]
MSKKTFKTEAPKYWSKNLSVVPVPPGTKQSIGGWQHYQNNLPNLKKRDEWQQSYGDYGIAVLTGTALEDGTRLAAIDIDNDDYVEPIKRIVGNFPCAKKGKKGLTIFVRVSKDAKSRALPLMGSRIVDVLVSKRLCVLPPTIHPDTEKPYKWEGLPLDEVDLNFLPFMDELQIDVLQEIIEYEFHKSIMEGEGTHDPALRLMASIAGKFDDGDEELVCRTVEAFLPEGYQGNLREELPGMFRSAKAKFGDSDAPEYDPGDIGPIPLGYTQHNAYVFMNQKKKMLSILQPQSLLAEGNLLDLAPRDFLAPFFPRFDKKGNVVGINVLHAADYLMQACREAGPFFSENVRGSGIWREGPKIVMNWSGDVPKSKDFTYIRFMSVPDFNKSEQIEPRRVLDWLKMFNWEHPGYALLAFGWAASAPVCGALDWRPHIFINGPKNSGKSTIIGGLANLLAPMAIVRDGSSSEAGVRQTVGADSRPVILDEFESDHDVFRMKNVIKMIRSASSAKGAIAKGTPEGKALQFQLHSTFCLGAINPMRGTAADSSRIVNLCLASHNNDVAVKDKIQAALEDLHRTRGAWPYQMVGLVETMSGNIDAFTRAMPPMDSRHATNMATLLAAAFTALNAKAVSKEEVQAAISEVADLIDLLAQAHEDNDAMDCLNHLLCFNTGDITIGALVNDARGPGNAQMSGLFPGLELYGIRVKKEGVLVANKHPGLDQIFRNSIWASGAWVSALRRLPGALSDDIRIRFSGGMQQRCTLIPHVLFEETSPPQALIKRGT